MLPQTEQGAVDSLTPLLTSASLVTQNQDIVIGGLTKIKVFSSENYVWTTTADDKTKNFEILASVPLLSSRPL